MQGYPGAKKFLALGKPEERAAEIVGGMKGKLHVWEEVIPSGVSGLLCRYVVCRGLKSGIDDVREYLFMVNIKLNQLRNSDMDVNLVVPLEVIKGDHEFYDYMVQSNER